MKMGQKRTEPQKPMKKRSTKSLPMMKRRVWEVFSKYIRTRDCLLATGSLEYGECITCDFSGHISYLQAGHFIPGRFNAYLFSERGVHTQCAHCNFTLEGNTLEYRRQIIKLYGENADLELEEEAKVIKKYSLSELEDLLVYFQVKIKELEEWR